MRDERRLDGERGSGAAHGARLGGQVGTAVGAAAGSTVEEAVQRAGTAATALSGGYGPVRERVAAADAGALVRQVGDVLEGVVEDGRSLTATALGRHPVKRWPWTAGAAVAGALAGAGVAYALRRLVGQDAPGALEPEQLRAVVDTSLADRPPPA